MSQELALQFEAALDRCPAIAILRGISLAEIPEVCAVLKKYGFSLLEIPLNTPDAYNCIRKAAEICGEDQLVGAGTVLEPEQVEAVRAAGGKFIISPNTEVSVIQAAKRLGMISMPGFFTASEAFTAIRAGADYLKLFPAVLGPGYVKDLKAVVKKPIMAVGGVTPANTPEFLKVCRGVGIGSALYKAGKSLADFERDAQLIAAACKSAVK